MSGKRSASPPPFNPFRGVVAETLLPRGARISLILGLGFHTPKGKRVVSGIVQGYAVRGAQFVDVVLRRIQTWIYDPLCPRVENLPADFESVFRVELRDGVHHTLGELRTPSHTGRSVLCANEVPFGACPGCGSTSLVPQGRYCATCGVRVSVGGEAPLPSVYPASHARVSFCVFCWSQRRTPGRFCVDCGTDRNISERARTLVGVRGRFVLTQGRRRVGWFSGEVMEVDVRRVNPSEGGRLFLQVGSVEWEGRTEVPPLPEGFRTIVSVTFPQGTIEDALRALEAGDRVFASEPLWRCPVCRHDLGWTAWSPGEPEPARAPRNVRGRFCVTCGTRCRIHPHLQFAQVRRGRRGASRDAVHACGALVARADAFCGGCGEELTSAQPSLRNLGDVGASSGADISDEPIETPLPPAASFFRRVAVADPEELAIND